MVAWSSAVLVNTAAAYRGFLALYPDSDLTATANKLIERLRYRPDPTPAAALSVPATNVALAAPTCPCNATPTQQQKADAPVKKRVVSDRRTCWHVCVGRSCPTNPLPHWYHGKPLGLHLESWIEVVRRPPPAVVYEPVGPPVGIGIGIGGGGYRGGYGGGYRGGRY